MLSFYEWVERNFEKDLFRSGFELSFLEVLYAMNNNEYRKLRILTRITFTEGFNDRGLKVKADMLSLAHAHKPRLHAFL